MAILKPFRALRYDTQKTNTSLDKLVCPPYDVIDPSLQEELHAKSPHNVVCVEFGRKLPNDSPGNDCYVRAAAILREWIAGGVLRQDSRPAFYLYEQRFDIASGGASRSHVVVRRGILGACRLEPFGTGCVFPHEETFGGPKADRLNLMRACSANLSPVFGLLPDEDGRISRLLDQGVALKPVDVEVREESGVVNTLRVINDEPWCAAIAGALLPRNLFIADGHHRYETSCNYRDERRKQDGDAEGKLDRDYNYTLMMCVPMSDPGLYILPTHRLIHAAPGISKESLLAGAKECFEQRGATEDELLQLVEEQTGPVKLGVIFKDGSKAVLSVTPTAAAAMRATAPSKSDAWRSLDVSILQELVLKGLLRLSEEKVLRKEGVSYTPDARLALRKVTDAASPYAMGFILRPTRIEQVREVAAGGEKMPQKSTYFYPKLLTGLVIRKI